MQASNFWLTLVSGVVIGVLFTMLLRWIGRKVLPRIRGKREVMPIKERQQIQDKIN